MLSGNTVLITYAFSSYQETIVPVLVPEIPTHPVTIGSVFSRKTGRTGSWEVFFFLTPSTGAKKGGIFRKPRALLGWKESTAIHIIEAESLAHLRGSLKQCQAQQQLVLVVGRCAALTKGRRSWEHLRGHMGSQQKLLLLHFQYRQTIKQMDQLYLKIQLCGHAVTPVDKAKIFPCVHYFE